MALDDLQHSVRSQIDLLEAQRRTLERNLGHANVIFDRLVKEIGEFETGLGNDEEIGGYLAAFGREMLVGLETVSYRDPYLILFEGRLIGSGTRIRLVQHVSQLNVLFTAVPKSPEHPVPKRIGFAASGEDLALEG